MNAESLEVSQTTLGKRVKEKILFDEEIFRISTIQKRLAENADLLSDKFSSPALTHINQYITHITVRSALGDNRLARIPVVLRESMSKRYHRFSKGTMSALKDLTL